MRLPILCSKLQDSSWGYKTFFYETELMSLSSKAVSNSAGQIHMKLSSNMLEGSTGCFQWEAGFLLGAFILSHPQIFSGKQAIFALSTIKTTLPLLDAIIYRRPSEDQLIHPDFPKLTMSEQCDELSA